MMSRRSDQPCGCIEPESIVGRHGGHCCLSLDTPRAEGYPPAPACHPKEWRARYGANHEPQQPELPQEFLDLMGES